MSTLGRSSISYKHACFLYHSVGAQESLNEKVTLKPCDTYDLSRVQTPADYQTLANSTEALEGIEACMLVWIKQVEQVNYRWREVHYRCREVQ